MGLPDFWEEQKNPRLAELMKWRRHHAASIREIDAEIEQVRKTRDLGKAYKEYLGENR